MQARVWAVSCAFWSPFFLNGHYDEREVPHYECFIWKALVLVESVKELSLVAVVLK